MVDDDAFWGVLFMFVPVFADPDEVRKETVVWFSDISPKIVGSQAKRILLRMKVEMQILGSLL